VDHQGVTNGQLAKENDPIAVLYHNQSPAEQHSVTVAWELLMRPEYDKLRACLFSDQAEMKRFRQLLVNSVMATDIFDPELKKMREARWQKAFPSDGENAGTGMSANSFHLKSTIIIEYLIQASDVAHTMQHWTIYRKWNTRLFQEMYAAYMSGRSPTNPADGWYKGELWFFDNYIVRAIRLPALWLLLLRMTLTHFGFRL
jgi:3'5'-cyclic nucleotide phosphodiesterase